MNNPIDDMIRYLETSPSLKDVDTSKFLEMLKMAKKDPDTERSVVALTNEAWHQGYIAGSPM